MSYKRPRLSFLEYLDLGLIAVQTGEDISSHIPVDYLYQ